MQGQVHLRQRHRVVGLLGAEDRELPGGGLVVTLDELRALDEHAARATGRIEDAALIGLQDLDDQPDDGVGREVLTTALALLGGEVGEEVLVDEAEGVAGELGREGREEAQQLDQGRALQLLVAARQDVLQLRVGGLDRLDRLVDGLADVVALRQPDQVGQPGLVGDVEHRPGLVVRDRGRVPRGRLGLDLASHGLEAVLGVREEHQTEHRVAVLDRGELGVGAELVGRCPQRRAHLGEVGRLHHGRLSAHFEERVRTRVIADASGSPLEDAGGVLVVLRQQPLDRLVGLQQVVAMGSGVPVEPVQGPALGLLVVLHPSLRSVGPLRAQRRIPRRPMLDDRHGATAHAVLHTHLVPHLGRDLLLAEPPDPREIGLWDGHGLSI